ncbi:MAG: TetR family transcriptional regulator C-terminal domain-containing protein, partial [Lachnospiraceae bacterium]|nr:TetR family transcriptional regulator C-terminal domain-containing protein [Lachnospiraceae bacterium]
LIEEIVLEETNRIVEDYPSIDSIETVLKAVIDFASKYRKPILHIYNSVNRDIFERYLWDVCRYVVNRYGSTAFEGVDLEPADRDVIERFYRCECFGIVLEWLNDNMTGDVSSQIERFCELHKGMPEEMIKRCLERKNR